MATVYYAGMAEWLGTAFPTLLREFNSHYLLFGEMAEWLKAPGC